MSSPPSPSPSLSTSKEKHTNRHDSNFTMPTSSVHKCDTPLKLGSTSHPNPVPTWAAIRATSHRPSGSSTSTTMLDALYGGGARDDAVYVTLQDGFPWYEDRVHKPAHRNQPTIIPALLQAPIDHSPSRSSFDESGLFEVDKESTDSEGVLSRSSASQKGKWNGDFTGSVSSPSPHFHFESIHNSVADWVAHSRPILKDYADRQTSLPLGTRLEVTIDEPPKFILGAIHLLVNRDSGDCTARSRGIGPQLIENFVDIDLWAKEYFRSRHGTQVVDSDVPTLLTIVMNNFYEGQVQLIDRLVEFALQNMHFCGRSSLGIEDFAFGFDFRMSQDLPFYVETNSRIRMPLPIPAVEVTPCLARRTSGRTAKLTERAQAATEQANERRNKEKNSSEVKDKQAVKITTPSAHQKKKTAAQSSSQHSEASVTVHGKSHAAPTPPTASSKHTKHRIKRPSNLAPSPILSTSASTPETAWADDSNNSGPSASISAPSPKVSDSGSDLTVNRPVRLKIRLPPPNSITVTGAMNDSDSSSSTTNNSTSQVNPSVDTSATTDTGRGAPRARADRPRGSRNRGRGRGRERGRTPVNLSTEIPGNAAVNAHVQSVGVRDTGSPALASPPAASSSTRVDRRSVGKTTKAQSGDVDNAGTRKNDRLSAPRRMRTGQQPPRPATDAGHPRAKKRKLDDCDD